MARSGPVFAFLAAGNWSKPLPKNGLPLVGVGVGVAVGVGVGFCAHRGGRRGVRLVFGIAGVLAVARLNGAGRGAGHGGTLSACRADRLADQPREEGSEEVEGHP